MRTKTQFVTDIRDKDAIRSAFLIKQFSVQTGKNGKPYMNLVLVDRTGEIEARIWDSVSEMVSDVQPNRIIWVEGRCQLYQSRRQAVISTIESTKEGEFELSDFMPRPRVDVSAELKKLDALIASMQDEHYRALAEATFIEDADVRERLKRAPAAKTMHHAYSAGLLEHMVSVVQVLDLLSKHYGRLVNRDLLMIGGFFHDIGKVWELTYDMGFDYSTEGRLVGHLVMGVELIESKIQKLNAQPGRLKTPFPEEKRLLAKHMVLAHHGKLEYGSPKEPHVLEALIVHMVDDLDSKVNAISQFALADEQPGEWTGINRQFNRYFFKSLFEKNASHSPS